MAIHGIKSFKRQFVNQILVLLESSSDPHHISTLTPTWIIGPDWWPIKPTRGLFGHFVITSPFLVWFGEIKFIKTVKIRGIEYYCSLFWLLKKIYKYDLKSRNLHEYDLKSRDHCWQKLFVLGQHIWQLSFKTWESISSKRQFSWKKKMRNV